MKKKILLISLIFSLILTGCSDKEKEGTDVLEKDGILSYTIDGESTSEQPTKESGYIVNKINCDGDIDLMWDNDNWEVEFTNITFGKCTVDFTKDESTQGYRVTVTSNSPSSLDSLSKSTVENGTVKIYSNSKIESVTGCNGIVEDNKVIVSDVTENQTCNITVKYKTLAEILKIAYPPKSGRTSFNNIDNATPGLYTDEDDQGTTYYFSGDGTNMNNWVSFAEKKWRVIRINGNGSVRLLHAGTGGTDAYIGEQAFNTNTTLPGFIGWKYSLGDSLESIRGNTIKSGAYTAVENWYNALSSADKNYIDTEAIYCNDRELTPGSSFSTSSTFYYAAYGRLEKSKTPTFKCSSTKDRFNTFGLMTADEVVYAGGVFDINNSKAYYYLNASNKSSVGDKVWWTMTPYNFFSVSSLMFIVSGTSNPGKLSWYNINTSSFVIRPVISLEAEVEVTGGDGSSKSPYEVSYKIKNWF